MTKFKEGDKVRIISAFPPSHNGETATFNGITVTDGTSYDVILNNGGLWRCRKIELAEPAIDAREQAIYKRLAKVKRPKPKELKKGEFKKGDWVKCIADDYCPGRFTKGGEYKVSYCDGNLINFYSTDEGRNDGCNSGRFQHYEGAFELADALS